MYRDRDWVELYLMCQIFSKKAFLDEGLGNFSSYNFPKGNFPNVRLGLLTRCSLLLGGGGGKRCGYDGLRDRALHLYQASEPSASARTDLKSCRLRNHTFVKFPFWGKKPQKVAVWERVFGKVPNMVLIKSHSWWITLY